MEKQLVQSTAIQKLQERVMNITTEEEMDELIQELYDTKDNS